MAVQITITFDELVEVVKRLNPTEKQMLREKLDEDAYDPSQLSAEEFSRILDDMVIKGAKLGPGYSDRRQDWYNDDGR